MKTIKIDTVGCDHIPGTLLISLVRYAEDRVRPSLSTLSCALSNDLLGVMRHACRDTLVALPHIMEFIQKRLPPECWGSDERYQLWLDPVEPCTHALPKYWHMGDLMAKAEEFLTSPESAASYIGELSQQALAEFYAEVERQKWRRQMPCTLRIPDTDWYALRQQKDCLAGVAEQEAASGADSNVLLLEGLLSFLDSVQDAAAVALGDEIVYPKTGNDDE